MDRGIRGDAAAPQYLCRMAFLLRTSLVALVLAVTACGDPVAPREPFDGVPLAPNEIRVSGRIESASRLVAVPVKLTIPSSSDPFGEGNVLDSTMSGAADGRYELTAIVTPAECAGEFLINLYDAFGRFVGKPLTGCGQYFETFNIGIGIPAN